MALQEATVTFARRGSGKGLVCYKKKKNQRILVLVEHEVVCWEVCNEVQLSRKAAVKQDLLQREKRLSSENSMVT